MNIGRVEGTVVCTVKTPTLEGIKLMAVRRIVNGVDKDLVIACDGTRQAGIGDTVYMIGRAEAHPLVQAFLTAFPGAAIRDVRPAGAPGAEAPPPPVISGATVKPMLALLFVMESNV